MAVADTQFPLYFHVCAMSAIAAKLCFLVACCTERWHMHKDGRVVWRAKHRPLMPPEPGRKLDPKTSSLSALLRPGARARQGYTCVMATPCLAGGNCTQRCVPLAAAFCADVCPNALDATPPSGASADTNGATPSPTPDPSTALGPSAGPALTDPSNPSAGVGFSITPASPSGGLNGGTGSASMWVPGAALGEPGQATVRHVWTLPPFNG